MSNPTTPPKGQMQLFDYLTVPLDPGSYRLHVESQVTHDPGQTATMTNDGYFDVVGPRFSLSPSDVAGTYPPRNGHGPFSDSLAQVVLKRRALPWERKLDAARPGGPLPAPSGGNQLAPGYPRPWMTLLVFEEGEYTLLPGVPLDKVMPKANFVALGSPAGITCDAVEADASLVQSILPSLEELQLLAHVRWVNIEDRELTVEGSDGWFAVVVGSRVPSSGAKCRACLVSLEERWDLVKSDPPASTEPGQSGPIFVPIQFPDYQPPVQNQYRWVEQPPDYSQVQIIMAPPAKTRLVVLFSWQFTCEGPGSFRDLMKNLDIGMIGAVQDAGKPALTDTCHLPLMLGERSGETETVLYRGPLVPFELTRDTLGPYHGADQARRVTPETGVEDVSYAAAFEVGRLLAAADARLAQELMRWRRGSYRQAARADTLLAIQASLTLNMPATLAEQLQVSLPPILATAAMGRMVQGAGPVADRYGLKAAGQTVGMNPAAVKEAWGLASLLEAQAILGGDPGALGLEIAPVPQTPRPNVTIATVAADAAGLGVLVKARDRVITSTKAKLGG